MNQHDDNDDVSLFRAAMRDVKPLPASDRLAAGGTRLSPRPSQKEADERAVLVDMMEGPPIDSGEELAFRTNGIQDTVFRKLKRGIFRVGDELDLHGLRANEAKHEVARFIGDCRVRDLRCVRIIHGKGLRSKGDGPVLKQHLDGWLRRRDDVLAFCSARPQDGGTGAVYVLLRAPER